MKNTYLQKKIKSRNKRVAVKICLEEGLKYILKRSKRLEDLI